jgi:hypothetical protein
MGFFPMSGEATSGLPRVKNGEFYPSFLPILASITFLIGKWKLAKKIFHKIIGNFSKLWGKNNSP